jgi:hypothetical protein
MRLGSNSDAKRGMRAEHGGISVEFAIIFPVLMLLVFGIVDLGHAWYMRHLMSDASREGARYATPRLLRAGRAPPKPMPPFWREKIIASPSRPKKTGLSSARSSPVSGTALLSV